MKTIKYTILIFICLSTFTGMAQTEYTNESVKDGLKKAYVEFVNNVRPFYKNGDTYTNFKQKALLGTVKPPAYTLPPVPVQGEDLLKAAYKSLTANYSNSQLYEKADYKSYGKAVLFLDSYIKDTGNDVAAAEVELFGGNAQLLRNNSLAENTRAAKKCKWWQLWCHLDQVFGNGGGGQILQAIITAIITLL